MNLAVVYKLRATYSSSMNNDATTQTPSETQSFANRSDRTYLTVRSTFVSSREQISSFDSILTLRKIPSAGFDFHSFDSMSRYCLSKNDEDAPSGVDGLSRLQSTLSPPVCSVFSFWKDESPWMLNAVNIARLWFFASFCVNFFVYAICGRRFRSETVRLFSCCSRSAPSERISTTISAAAAFVLRCRLFVGVIRVDRWFRVALSFRFFVLSAVTTEDGQKSESCNTSSR